MSTTETATFNNLHINDYLMMNDTELNMHNCCYFDNNGKYVMKQRNNDRNVKRWDKIFQNVIDNKAVEKTSTNNSYSEINTAQETVQLFLKQQKQKIMDRKKKRQQKSAEYQQQAERRFTIPELILASESTQTSLIKDETATDTKEDGAGKDLLSTDAAAANTPVEEEDNKKQMKIKFGVADFIKKVKDNEGMGISTFEEDNELGLKKDKVRTKLSTDKFLRTLKKARVIHEERKTRILTANEKFLETIHKINTLLKTIRTSGEQTRLNNKKFLTFADYQDNETEEKKTNLYFDTSIFKVKKERTLNVDAVEILKVDRNHRSPAMIHTAIVGLNQTVEAFGEFPIGMQQKLIEKGWYEKFEARRTIIRQGHNALNYYFIISGTTTISVARKNKATGETYSETVAFLKKGNSFGELALMFGGKRSASVGCKTDVELLSVSRADFIDIFMSVSSSEEPDHIKFLRQLPLISGHWPIDKLPYDDPSICLFTYFRRGTVLCHDSNNGSWVYIVKTGSCRVIKHLELTGDNDLRAAKHKDKRYVDFLTKETIYGSNRDKQAVRRIPPPPVKQTEDLKARFYVELKKLGPGCIFGLEPMAFEFVGGTTSVTFVSDGAELIAIEIEFFRKYMSRHYQSWLRKELQPFPVVDELKVQVKEYYKWIEYKENMVKDAIQYIDQF